MAGLMTMDVDPKQTLGQQYNHPSGQGLLEFLTVLPLVMGLAVVLIRVNTAIQVSIVDQQYARAQALFLAFNSPFFPEVDKQVDLIKSGFNQIMLGVSENQAVPGYSPKATVQFIGRRKGLPGGSNADKEEPPNRYGVRIRNSATLCTANFLLNPGSPVIDLEGGAAGGGDSKASNMSVVVAGNARLTNSSRFNYMCGSPLKYYE